MGNKRVIQAYIQASTLAKKAACCIDEQGKIVGCNTQLEALLGYQHPLAELRIVDIDANMSLFSWLSYWKQLETEQNIQQESNLIKKNNEILTVQTTATFIKDDAISFCYLLIEAEQSPIGTRSVSDEMMKYAVDNAREMIFWIDAKGSIIYINNRVVEASGVSQTTATRMKVWHFSNAIKGKADWDTHFQMAKEYRHFHFEIGEDRKDGTKEYLKTISTYMNYSGKEYVFSIVMNVTKEKEDERKLRRLSTELKNERNYLQQEIISVHNFNEIISNDEAYKKILRQMQQVADTDATVLILGETGTGKELIARAIHNLSSRRNKPMVKVNCAALPTNLIESELFGHEKGAFTGAFKQKVGRFELADKGTIFLDEIGEMPLDLQSKLLRALQEGEFERLGSTNTIKVDVRVIAATNRQLIKMVAKGEFREDLYYRLNVFPIHNIPLRQRKGDIPLLVNFFVEKYCKKQGRPKLKITQASLNRLARYEFPGNIRELENLIERAIILSNAETLNINAALPKLEDTTTEVEHTFLSLEDVQRAHILEALKRSDWKVTGKQSAADLLQINGKTLASKIKKLNIHKPTRLI